MVIARSAQSHELQKPVLGFGFHATHPFLGTRPLKVPCLTVLPVPVLERESPAPGEVVSASAHTLPYPWEPAPPLQGLSASRVVARGDPGPPPSTPPFRAAFQAHSTPPRVESSGSTRMGIKPHSKSIRGW